MWKRGREGGNRAASDYGRAHNEKGRGLKIEACLPIQLVSLSIFSLPPIRLINVHLGLLDIQIPSLPHTLDLLWDLPHRWYLLLKSLKLTSFPHNILICLLLLENQSCPQQESCNRIQSLMGGVDLLTSTTFSIGWAMHRVYF